MKRVEAADVRRQVSILSLLSPDQPTRKTAANRWMTRCTFHEDGRPSMSVSYANDIGWVYNCFACGARGDVIKYVMERDRLTFRDAMERLGSGVIEMAPPPPAPKPRFELACDQRGCARRIDVMTIEAIAYVYQRGWRLDDDGRGWCGWCLERALVRRRQAGMRAI